MHQGTKSGGIIAPMFALLLKIPVASARSFLGNHSAMVLIDAGKLPASPMPNKLRIITCRVIVLPASAFNIPKTDHMISDKARPNFVPILSIIQPADTVTPA